MGTKIVSLPMAMVFRMTIIVLIALVTLITANPATVGAACMSTGTPSIATDKPNYEPGETAIITGQGFECGGVLTVKVTRPDGTVVTGDGSGTSGSDTVTVDSQGTFTYSYQLNGIEGVYKVDIRDTSGNVLATTTFTDTHFRFGHLAWIATSDIGPNTVEFKLVNAFRRSGFGGPGAPVSGPTGVCNTCPPGQLANVGDIITEEIGFTQLLAGDGTIIPSPFEALQYRVIGADANQDFIIGEALNTVHTYAGAGPFTARIDSCCRLADSRHINNFSGSYRVETIVDLRGGDTGSPVSLLPPIVDCPQNALCQFQIIAADPDGGALTFRLSTGVESRLTNQPGPPFAPNAASVATSNCFGFPCGTYTWDTTGATLNPGGETLYSTQVMVEETDGVRSASDFFIRLVAPTPPPSGALIKIPLRWCGVEGAPSMVDPSLVGEASTHDVLWRRHERISDNIYIPQSGITFRSGAVAALPDFPVIPDPDPINTPGGNIMDPNLDGGAEMIRMINRCRAAWQSAPEVTGMVAIHLNEYVDGSNNQTGLLGIAMIPQLSNTASQMLFGYGTTVDNRYTLQGEILGDGVGNDDRRCDPGEACQGALETIGDGVGNDDGVCEPGEACRREVIGDGIGDDDGFCELPGEACLILTGNGDPFDTLLGHELGHGLTMFHGDGQDNDGDLAELIGDGVGDDDGICEPGELCDGLDEPGEVFFPTNGPNLMQYRNGSLLTNNQRDRIRNQALLHIPDIEVDPVIPPLASARVDVLGDVPQGEEFVDVDALGVAVDQQNGTTVFTISTAGLLPDNVSGLRYVFFADTDNDTGTGGDPSSIPGVRSAQGIELVGIVDVSMSGGVPMANATVYKFDPPNNQFVQAIDPSIQAQVITNLVAPISEDELDSEPFGISESIQLQMSNSVRGPVDTNLNMEVMAENSNTGTIDEGEGPLTFAIVDFPECTVIPPSTVLGALVTVDVTGLPPNGTAEVLLGPDLVATGPIDALGNASISFNIPTDTQTGNRLITVGAQGTAITADCAVFLEAAPEFDVPPTPSLGSTLTVAVGDTLIFDVQASDRDAGDVVSLDVIGAPLALGATFTSTPGNPTTGTFSWTPGTGGVGTYPITFTATDNTGRSAPPHTIFIQVIANRPPTANAGTDQTVEATSPAGTVVTLNGTSSSDPDDDTLTFSWSAPGIVFDDPTSSTPSATFPLGSTTVTLVVNDGTVDSEPDTVTITVEDTTPPTLTVPVDITVECDTVGGTEISNPGIQAFLNSATATDIVDPAPTITNNAPGFCPLGDTVVTFTATDFSGNSTSASSTITVVDTTPPMLIVTADQTSLWPPNGKYQLITLSITATDVCDSSPTVTAVVQSNEPDDAKGNGDGNTTGDIKVTTSGGPVLLSSNAVPQVAFDPINDNLELRAERAGSGTGRTYTITITATDASGNQTIEIVTVTVPHDQGQ